MIAAIVRAQLLSMRMGRRSLRGAWFAALSALIWYGFWAFASVATYRLAVAASAASMPMGLRAGLFLIFTYWQLMPLLSTSLGAGLDLRRLQVFPVAVEKLFLIELLLRALTSVEMLMVLCGGAAGLIGHKDLGGWHVVPRVALAALSFAAFNVALSSGMRSVIERLLARGRVREFVVLIAVSGLLLPRFFAITGVHPEWMRHVAEMREDGMPWTAAAHALTGHATLGYLCALAAWLALALWFGRWQFLRTLSFDTLAAQSSQTSPENSLRRAVVEAFYGFPARVWSDPLAALIEKELRTLSRTPRFRMVFVMGICFGLLVWMPLVVGRGAEHAGALGRHFLAVVTVYSMTLLGQVSYWNAFGFDRSAAVIYYVAPLPIARVLAAKNLAALVFVYLEAGILVLVTLALRVHLDAVQLLEMAVVLTVSATYMLALGNISSVEYPRALNPERVAQGGATTRMQALIFLLYPLALLPILLAYLARALLNSDLVFWLLIAMAAVIGGVLYWIATESARATAVRRREEILHELTQGEGLVTGG